MDKELMDIRNEGEPLYESARDVVNEARNKVLVAANSAMVEAYWEIGRQIDEHIGPRAEYGKDLLGYLSERLTAEFGKGFSIQNLRRMRQFYQAFPIRSTLSSELGWSHYLQLIGIEDADARTFYQEQAIASHMSVRELRRSIETHAYERLLSTQLKGVSQDSAGDLGIMQSCGSVSNVVKDPYLLEFLDLDPAKNLLERDLESALIDGLRDFLLELGNGFAFVGRQQRVSVDGRDYYIDLVFYNFNLHCHVLIDLKVRAPKPQDVGQMDFYTRLYDDKYRPAGDAPTIGIILCTERTEAVARYSNLYDHENLYAAQYKTVLPSEETLEKVLERNRREFERASEARILEQGRPASDSIAHVDESQGGGE